jgi:aminopeptidase 2
MSTSAKTVQSSYLVNYRLGKQIIPIDYELKLKPDIRNFTFQAIIEIKIRVKTTVSNIVLHSKDLHIQKVCLDSTIIKETSIDTEVENDLLILQTPNLYPGIYFLTITYDGVINNSMKGLYYSTYELLSKNDNSVKETKYMISTQFESTYCRMLMPCFDEPSFKAKFNLIITTDENLTVLSNTNPKHTIVENHMQTITFSQTPIMSTYLLALVVGELECIETTIPTTQQNNPIRIRGYTTVGQSEKIKFALDTTAKALDFFNKYFQITYVMNKLDFVAIPEFSAGAMENFGLITYRQMYVLADEHTSLAEKQDICITICHELAHQWFGNLVTMEWWDDLWLNEAMATYLGTYAANKLYPEWNLWQHFISSEYSYAMELDSLKSSHPIHADVKSTNEIDDIFDAISYSKGACVVRFVAESLGEECFRIGMRNYLSKHAWTNTVANDLWNAF